MVGLTARPNQKRHLPIAPAMMKLTGVFSISFKVKIFDEFLNTFFSSHSIPFSNKFEFMATTTWRLMAHLFDIARDIILILYLKAIIEGAAYIFKWVNIH